MKIALFTDTYFPQVNGVATSVKNLADHLRAKGNDVVIFAPKIEASKFDAAEKVIRIESVKVFPNIDEVRLPLVFADRLNKINKVDFDIVHAHGNALFSLLGYFAAKKKGVPFVLTFHTFIEDYTHYLHAGKNLSKPFVAGIYRFYASLCDAIIAPSGKMKHTLVAHKIKKDITIIPNIINLEKFSTGRDGFLQDLLKIDEASPVLLFVGRVAKEKGVSFLINTFSKVQKDKENVHLVIAGTGPKLAECKQLVKKLGIEDNVHFLGIVDRADMPSVYASSEVFVMPSTSEVHPMVVLEAAASGLPLIVAKDAAFENLVVEGENGFQLPLDGKVFADKILELVANKKKLKELSNASREIVSKNFSEGSLTSKFESLYSKLIEGREGRPVQLVRESNLKIIVATDVFYPTTGGVPVAITALVKGLSERGHSVLVVAPSNSLRTYQETYEGVRVYRIGSLSLLKKRNLRLPFNVREIRKVIEDFSPDIVHVCTPGVICENTLKVAKKRGITLVGTGHVIPDNLLSPYHLPAYVERRLGVFLAKRLVSFYKKLDKMTAPSPFASSLFNDLGVGGVVPISNGVDLKLFASAAKEDGRQVAKKLKIKEKKVVLYVGRLDREKRVDVLLRAIAKVKDKDFGVVIAGHGVDEQKLVRLCGSLKIANRVHFIGYVENDHLPSLYRMADIFVMPGDAELQSISTLEAMASSQPVVACDAKALPDLVESGVNGYLYEKNNPESLAKYLQKLLTDEGLREQMGKMSLEKVREHDISNTIAKYESLYINTINEKLQEKQIEEKLKRFNLGRFLFPFSVAIVIFALLVWEFGFVIPSDIKAAQSKAQQTIVSVKDKGVDTFKSGYRKVSNITVGEDF